MKRNKNFIVILFICLCLTLSSCANYKGSKSIGGAAIGTGIGAIIGQIIGGDTGATLLGAGIGFVFGAFAGNEIDKYDQKMMQGMYETNNTGQTTTWVNPDNKVSYQATPTRTYYQNNGQPCREAKWKAMINGKQETVYKTACRDASGRWTW